MDNIVITFAPHVRRWFQDIAIAAARSLKELGKSCNVIACNKIDDFNKDPYDTIIVLAPHAYTQLNLNPTFAKMPDKKYIAWCMEQTPHANESCPIMDRNWQRTLTYIDKYDYFFTESEVKTEFINSQGHKAFTASIGYHEHFNLFEKEFHKDQDHKKNYDVFFLGAMYPRRSKIINELKELGLKIYPSTGNMFDPIVKTHAAKRCKVGLNIHHNDVQYFEKPRIIQDYMSNFIPVITETIANPEGFKNNEHFVMAPHEKLAKSVFEWCNKPQSALDALAVNAHEYISNCYTMTNFMRHMVATVKSHQAKKISQSNTHLFMRKPPMLNKERYNFMQPLCIDKVVLDVACQTGEGTNILATSASKAIGIDDYDSQIEHARATFQLPTFSTGNILRTGFGRKTFDLVFMFDVLQYVSDYKGALDEALRIMKRDGKLIISVPNKEADQESCKYVVNEWSHHEVLSLLKTRFKKVLSYGQKEDKSRKIEFGVKDGDQHIICVATGRI